MCICTYVYVYVHTYVYSCVCMYMYVYIYMCVVRTSKIYSYNNFQVYNTVLLAIVIILYIRSPQLIQLITGILYHLTNITSLAPPSNAPAITFPLLLPWVWLFKNSTCKWDHTVSVSLWLLLLSIMPSGSIPIVANGFPIFLWLNNVLLYICMYVCVHVCIYTYIWHFLINLLINT